MLENGLFVVPYTMAVSGYFDVYYRASLDGTAWSNAFQVTTDPSRYDTQPHPPLQGTPSKLILTWSHQVSSQPYEDHDIWIETDLLIPSDLQNSATIPEPAFFTPRDVLAATLTLINEGYWDAQAALTDTIPLSATYQDGSLWASSGNYGYDPISQVITWTGTVSATQSVTVTFRLETDLNLSDGFLLTNQAALIDKHMNEQFTLSASATADAAAPTSAMLDPMDRQVISATTYLLSGVANDGVSGVEAVYISIDDSPWQPALGKETWTYLWSDYSNGEHELSYFAVDRLGKIGEPGSITVTVDTMPPASTLLDPVEGQVISTTTYNLRGTASDALLGVKRVEISVDGGAWQTANGEENWTFEWTGYTNGEHNLRWRAVDTAGNKEMTSPGITVAIDTISPLLIAYTPLSNSLEVPITETIVLTFSEPVLTDTLVFVLSPDPGGWAITWNTDRIIVALSHSPFEKGHEYTFTLLAVKDMVGNPLTMPVQWTFTTVGLSELYY